MKGQKRKETIPGLRLFLKGTHPPIYLNAFMFARIIRDQASPPEEVSIRLFY